MSVSRDPSDYHPSVHAVDRHKRRAIKWEDVSETIQDGTVKQSHKPNCRLFVKDCGHTHPIGVVADVTNGEIVTVEFRK